MKCLACFAGLALFATFGAAQSDFFEQPYAIQGDGSLLGIAWKVKGAQRQVNDDNKDISSKVTFNLSIFGNDPFYAMVLRNRFSSAYTPVFSLTALRSVQGDNNLPTANSTAKGAKTGFKASHITFGGGTTRVDRQWQGVTVTGDCVDLQPEVSLVSKETLTNVKRQKYWNNCNFRVTVGGAVIDDAISFDPITLSYAPFGDLDGDGIEDMALMGDSFSFEIPKSSKYGSTIFESALASTRAGSPKLLPARVEYLDEDGLTVLSLSFVVTVNGMDPSDMFFDPLAASNNVKVYTKIKKDLQVEMERRSGGF